MLKRLFSIFALIFLLSIGFSYADHCNFHSSNSNCETFSTPFNTFNLQFTAQQDLQDYEVIIFNQNNPSNKIKVEKNGNTVTNINPFTEPGVYTMRVTAKNTAQRSFIREFEFIFDNTKPNPPAIPLTLVSDSSSLQVTGKVKPSLKVYALNQDGVRTNANVDTNGDFTLDLPLQNGGSYHKFYTENTNGIASQPTERYVISQTNHRHIPSNYGIPNINSNLENLNERTIQTSLNNYVTSKRNFYVTGNVGIAGAKVYANGNPTISTSNGDFGVFVLLNEGENQVEVTSGPNSNTINVEYINPRFQFLQFDGEKIVDSASEAYTMQTNFDIPYNAYLNGEYKGPITPSSGISTISFTDIKPGKNYIYLDGVNGEAYSEVVYRDTQDPTIEILSQRLFADNKEFYFEIKDDMGIDTDSVSVTVGSQTFEDDSLTIKGDIYSVNLSSLQPGSHNFNIVATDRVGKQVTRSGSVNIDPTNTLIENIAGANLIGNRLYVAKGQRTLTLKPSRFIAFNSIFLDGVRQTNYEIKTNSEVEIQLDFQEDVGQLELNFINQNYDSFTQTLTYYSDDESPSIVLDYVDQSTTREDYPIRVTGTINDSHFNWNTLRLGGQNNFLRFGNNFEAYVQLNGDGDNSITISGEDYSLNQMDQNQITLYRDSTQTTLSFINQNDTISGAIVNNNNRVLNYVSSYDGFTTTRTPLEPNFDLAAHQRHGIRSVNLAGVEASENKFSSVQTIAVGDPKSLTNYSDNIDIPLKVYLTGNDLQVNQRNYFVQGQIISQSNITSVSVEGIQCEFDEYNFVCPVSLAAGENTIIVDVSNKDGEDDDENITINNSGPEFDVEILEIVQSPGVFKIGSNYYTTVTDFNLRANVSEQALITLLVDGRPELTSTRNGIFTLTVDISDQVAGKDHDEIDLQLEAEDELGNSKRSDIVRIIYSRVVDTLVEVFVG